MITRARPLVLVFVVAWLGLLDAASAGQTVRILGTVEEQLQQGELAAAKGMLETLRRERFPGVSFSGDTCREQPEFALMVAAEFKLASGDAVGAGNYLRQLQCLKRVRSATPTQKNSLALLDGFRDLVPARVDRCPFPLGNVALQRSAIALDSGRVSEAWGELLEAACLSGLESAEVREAEKRLKRLDKTADRVAAQTRAPSAVAPVKPARRPSAVVKKKPAPVDSVSSGALPPPAAEIEEPVETAGPEEGGSSLSDLISRQTSPGEIAFNPAPNMQVGKAELVEVRIQPDKVVDEGMLGRGDIQVEPIGVTSSMSVRLCCGAPDADSPFDIVAQSNEQQLVSRGSFTQWIFEVTPRKQGPQVLTLSVSAQYRFPNGEVIPKDFPVMTREIQVAVSEPVSLALWLSLAAVVAALGLLVFWWSSRKRTRPARIFVSYRRDDSSGWARGLHDRLAECFGEQMVFMDLNDITPGSDFVVALKRSLKETGVVLVVIGKRWTQARDSAGGRRLDDPADWVRLEVQSAISSGKHIIPVLVDGADMPDAADLPRDIQALSRFQAVKLYPDQFDSGIRVLIRAIDPGAKQK